MFQMLAILNPPTVILMLVVIAIVGIIVIPKLKKSTKVDKLANDLFKSPPEDSTNDLIGQMKDAKSGLQDKVKQNAKIVKDAQQDSEKITKRL